MHVYPLYPHVKRWLRVGMSVYLLFTGIFGYWLYRLYQDPHFNFSVALGSFWGLCALWGLVLCVHLYVLGTPSPPGMTPVGREFSSTKHHWWRRRTAFDGKKTTTGLTGDEAQPLSILSPVLIMLVPLLPAGLLFAFLLKLVEKLTPEYIRNPLAITPLKALMTTYGLLGVACGILCFKTYGGMWFMPCLCGALFSICGLMVAAYSLRQCLQWSGELEESSFMQNFEVGRRKRFRISFNMNGPLFVSMIPLGLVCLSFNGGWLLILLQ